jgi:acyl dehydratase
MLMRAVADGFLLRSTSMGAPGIEEVRWLKPVRPGDRLTLRWTVLETKASRSRPEMGLVRFRFELLRGDEAVLAQTNWIMFGRRGATAAEAREGDGDAVLGPEPRAATAAEATAPPLSPVRLSDDATPTPFFDDLAIGAARDLGTAAFTPEAIVGFASRFDPQRFHVDPDAARRSHFGALCASGWHTAAMWMKVMTENRRRADDTAREAGERPAVLGPSPGFRDLKWLKPVYAGDTIRYRSTPTEKRPSASRPGWGLVFQHNTGDNQHGERVFEFKSAVLWERKQAPFPGGRGMG